MLTRLTLTFRVSPLFERLGRLGRGAGGGRGVDRGSVLGAEARRRE